METAVVAAAFSPSCQRVLQHYVAAASGISWDNVSECLDCCGEKAIETLNIF